MQSLPSIRFHTVMPIFVAALLAASACSSGGGAGGSGGQTTSSTNSSSTTMSEAGGSGGACEGFPGATCDPSTHYGGGETSTAGGAVTAVIVDETGAPVVGQPVFICGIDVCSPPSKTGADGKVAISTTLSMKRPAFKFGDSVAYAELAIPLTAPSTDFTNGGTQGIATAKLADKPGAPLVPGQSATAGDVTIALPPGAAIGINTIVYDTCDRQLLRAVNIPLANTGPVLDPVVVDDAGAGFELLYGVAPAETTICPAAKVTVALPAGLGWAPGTAVEFWVMTTDSAQVYAPYAGWAKMSDGVVSTDGKTASTLDGQGFSLLENFAVRRAQ